jgi:hypothetical protein
MSYGNYVNNTIQQYGGDLTRPTKFNVVMTLPVKLKDGEKKQFSPKLNILAKSFAIPGIKNDPIEVKYKGHSIPIVGRSNFEQVISITFYLDEPQILRSVLDSWIRDLDKDIIGKNSTSFNHKGGEEKFGEILIESQNYNENAATRKFKFINVYPINVGGVQYNTDSPSTITEITVDFAYSYFESNKGDFDLSNIFEDYVSKGTDAALDYLFGEDKGADVKKTGAAVVDIFKGKL